MDQGTELVLVLCASNISPSLKGLNCQEVADWLGYFIRILVYFVLSMPL